MTPPSTRNVMHVIDSLQRGGAERVAVNLANQLHRYGYYGYLCYTRSGGPLAELIEPEVVRVSLARRNRFDPAAVLRLARVIKNNNVGIVHAHSSSLLIARIALALVPGPQLIWHDHYGGGDSSRPVLPYKLALKGIAGVIAVNPSLAEWAVKTLSFPRERVWYVPNFAVASSPASVFQPHLPGGPGMRIVCVANYRPQKDHLTLLQALNRVVKELPGAHLLLAGSPVDPDCVDNIHGFIRANNLGDNVTILGPVADVPSLLRVCDIGVLSSRSEGLPLALLEYGSAGLACVSTAVGQCPEVLVEGTAGILVEPGSPGELADGLLLLLRSPKLRRRLGEKLRLHVEARFGAERILRKIFRIYDQVSPVPETEERGPLKCN